MLSLILCLSLATRWVALPTSMGPGPAVVSSPADSSDVLRPGDLIRLRIWREPEFSGDFPVDERGVVVLPRLGALDVSSERPDSLKARLVRGYERFLNHSAIEIVFLHRVQITGAVGKPGLYHVEPLMTIADALALAGGVLSNGKEDKVQIIREGQKLPGTISGRVVIGESPVRSGDQLYVPQRSWLSRNTGLLLAGISTVTGIFYLAGR